MTTTTQPVADLTRLAGAPMHEQAGLPDRWAELRDFADAHLAEAEKFRPFLDDTTAARLAGELAAYRKLRTRMDEMEARQ